MAKSILRNRKGQGAIEFIVSSVVLFFFLLFFLSLSILLVMSEYIDYATFMAARTYKSGVDDETRQRVHGEIVFNSYMDKIQGMVRNYRVDFDPGDANSPAGAVATYEIDLFYLPPLFLSEQVPSKVQLSSETRLGRDPGFDECRNYFINFVQQFNGLQMNGLEGEMEDNGC